MVKYRQTILVYVVDRQVCGCEIYIRRFYIFVLLIEVSITIYGNTPAYLIHCRIYVPFFCFFETVFNMFA